MSAQHTPGRLAVTVQIFDNDGMPESAIQTLDGSATVAVALEFGPNNPGMREANARRLAACWNACEGVDTDLLNAAGDGILKKSLNKTSELHAMVKALEAQRDELLAALKNLRRAYVNLLESGRDRILLLGGQCDPVDVMEASDPNLRDSRAALAKVEGKA